MGSESKSFKSRGIRTQNMAPIERADPPIKDEPIDSSPPPEDVAMVDRAEVDPFQKRGLRRSPLTETVAQKNTLEGTRENHKTWQGIRKSEKTTLESDSLGPGGSRESLRQNSQREEIGRESQEDAAPSSLLSSVERTLAEETHSFGGAGPQRLTYQDFIEQAQDSLFVQSKSNSPTTYSRQTQGEEIFLEGSPGSVSQPAAIGLRDFPTLNLKQLPKVFLEYEPGPLKQQEPHDHIINAPSTQTFSKSNESVQSINMPSETQRYLLLKPGESTPTSSSVHRGLSQEDGAVNSGPRNELNARLSSSQQGLGFSSIIPDPHASKKAQRDSLLLELKQLRADVTLAKAENERLHLSKKVSSSLQDLTPEVYSMLIHATTLKKKADEPVKEKSIFDNINAFLPFNSKPRKVALAQMETALLGKRIPSHAPLAMEHPLPYLQAFTPLTWSSTMTVLQSTTASLSPHVPEEEGEGELLQQQIITASHPKGFFSARLALTIDTNSRRVRCLSLLRLPAFAEHELGSFIRNEKPGLRDPGQGNTSREVGVVCYAISRWLEVSLRRARFWWLVVTHYSTAEARSRSLQPKPKSRSKRKQIEGSDSDEIEGFGTARQTLKQLLPHLGRSTLCINNSSSETDTPSIELLFEWHLKIDWTGEVKSHLKAHARMPKLWQSLDAQFDFNRIPDLFRRLLQEKGALAAVAAVVSLTLGDGQ